MKKSVTGVFLGVLVFLALNALSALFGFVVQKIDALGFMSVVLTIILLLSGFVTGKYIGKQGFVYGSVTGIASYLAVITGILIFLFITLSNDVPGRGAELLGALGKFSGNLFFVVTPIAILASFVCGFGGFLGELFAKYTNTVD